METAVDAGMNPEEIMQAYEVRINLHQFHELTPLLASDAVFWFSNGSHTGIDEIQRAFEQTWQSIENEVYWLEEINWLAVGEGAASCLYRFHWKGTQNGQTIAGSGRGTTILRKQNGQWRIIHEHLSGLPRKNLSRLFRRKGAMTQGKANGN